MTRSKRFAANVVPATLRLAVGVLVVQLCMGLADGIVVRLGDGLAPYGPADAADVGIVHILPRLLSSAAKRQRAPPPLLIYAVRHLFPGRALPLQPTRLESARPWPSPLPYYPLSPAPERAPVVAASPERTPVVAASPEPTPVVVASPEQPPQRVVEEAALPRRLAAPRLRRPHRPSLLSKAEEQGSAAGRPGIDYPTLRTIPETSFSCKDQRYKGFFGDPETGCQAWHYCDFNGGQASFLCPNGTIFSQVLFTCDWWFNVDCNSTLQLYVINERLYKYIIPMAPSFPEDYHGPEVNQYLTMKFMELMRKEQKKLKEKLKSSEKNETLSEVNAIGSTINVNGLIDEPQQGLTNDLLNLEGVDELESKNIFTPS
ncbi:uncharacterized protein [Hetaerina americana]|uniref:uncharacterized protein n=1 Tax=Hetaerina americana TaxID=62018 RepID=UPI003A7F38CE